MEKLLKFIHSWYPMSCCSNQDCHPVDCNQIIDTSQGYIYDGITFSYDRVYPSLDQFCHACIHHYETVTNGLCLFIQMNM